MRTARTWLLALGFVAAWAAPGRADDAAGVIARAVRATAGSEDGLEKLRATIQTARGVIYLPGQDTPVERTAYVNPPDRLKYAGRMGPAGQQQPFAFCIDGLKGWQQLSGTVQDLSPLQYDAMQDEAYLLWVTSLVPLRQKGFTLKSLPDTRVNGQPAVGVQVTHPGRSAVQLYFDAGSSLLLRAVYRAREAGIEVGKDYTYADHRDFDGLKLPTRITVLQNNRKVEEWRVEGYRFPGKIEDSVFAKP